MLPVVLVDIVLKSWGLGQRMPDSGDCRGLVIRLDVARWTVDGRLRRESVCLIVYHWE